jgi:GTPase SAR1 family protein
MDSESTQILKNKCRKFRVLIIGRANAGKTTILQRVCDTIEEPEIYNKDGEKVGYDSDRGR